MDVKKTKKGKKLLLALFPLCLEDILSIRIKGYHTGIKKEENLFLRP